MKKFLSLALLLVSITCFGIQARCTSCKHDYKNSRSIAVNDVMDVDDATDVDDNAMDVDDAMNTDDIMDVDDVDYNGNKEAMVRFAHCNRHEEVTNKKNSALYAEIKANNADYATAYVAQPVIFPQKHAAILTCMDARLDPIAMIEFPTGQVHVIRNAGGRASDDAIRSLVISHKLLGTNQFFVIHHSDCGMQKFTNKVMARLLSRTLNTSTITHNCNVTLEPVQSNYVCQWKDTSNCCGKQACVDYDCIDWLTIEDGQYESVIEDVVTIRNHPLIPSDIPIYGFIFDVITGLLIPVCKADKAGKATPLYCKK